MECLRDNFTEGLLLDGRFETISPLNHGSFGMVFMAKDTKTEDIVAIKCLTKATPGNVCPSASIVDDQSDERACHARLGYHPNIVNLIHSFETDAHLYLVLEFCPMGDLYEAIRVGRGPLETEHVREFMLQLLDAVAHMHSKGLYHRDIKPENIFLAQDGSLKLGDFGLATTETWSYESSVGSDRYMSPEQYDSAGSGYSPAKADIWAVGICLLNIIFSRNPFVTPTESDLLFADYVRDRQSLFDVFPNMSQDTYEVLVHAIAINPEKRSLMAVRDAINRVISFTTDDEILDDFCTEDREVVPASANREPLRTPSLQSPHVDQGASFPWAKALHMTPPQRQLSVIPDTESYSEDMFPASEKGTSSWYSVAPQTPSMASVLDSSFGASFKLVNMTDSKGVSPPRSDPVSMTGSLPTRATKSLPALSMNFGDKNTTTSKSWSDLWDEEEEEGTDHEDSLQSRREHNSRSWSQESKDDDPTIRRGGLAELKNSSFVNTRTRSPEQNGVYANSTVFDGMNQNDGFFFEDRGPPATPRYSPPSKRGIMDKWAALGNRRRASQSNNTPGTSKRSVMGSWRKEGGMEFGYDGGVWDRKTHVKGSVKDWRCDMNRQYQPHSRDDEEWVGGWHDLHL
ncbi:hypothetical protein MMC16_000542 [Acarospora aff. strigata]|nr:hypothetical protein [Acarospora aff. strigata]